MLWNIGACIVRSSGPLKDLYDVRKVGELAKCEAIAADPVERTRYARAGRYAPKLHAHNRARRYVEKRFLRDLWRAWTGCRQTPERRASPAIAPRPHLHQSAATETSVQDAVSTARRAAGQASVLLIAPAAPLTPPAPAEVRWL